MSGGKSIWGAKHIYAYYQSGGGRMDGIQYLFPDFQQGKLPDRLRNSVDNGDYLGDIMFFIHDDNKNKKSYNLHDFGNYNWGGAMYELGFDKDDDLSYILEKAQGNENGNDTSADQQAITDGHENAKERKKE